MQHMEEEGTKNVKEIVIQSFSSFAFLVFEISGNEIITGVWAKDPQVEKSYRDKYLDTHIGDAQNDAVVTTSVAYIRKTFTTGENSLLEYATDFNGEPSKFILRCMPAPYNKEVVLFVAERIHREDAIEIVEDKWRIALDAAGDGVWDANMETGRMFFSRKWHEMFGYDEGEITNSEEWSKKIHPDDIAVARNNFERYVQGDAPSYSAQVRYVCKDGSYKWILSRGVVAGHNADGKPVRFLGTHTDIDKMKQQEQLYKESEQKYKALFDYSEAWICTHDMLGNILNVNPFACRSLGYTQEELMTKNLVELMPKAYRSRFTADYLQRITDHVSASGMMHVVDKDGQMKILLYKNYLFDNNTDHPYVIGFAQDITARVHAEEELKASIELFSSAFKYSGIGMSLVSPEGHWLEVNEAVCNMLGYSKGELMQLSFQDITLEEDLDKDLALVNKVLAKEIDTYTLEKRYKAKAGNIIWVSLTVSLVWNKDETPKFFISQMVDITERKELTLKLREKNEELETAQVSLTNKIGQLEELSYMIAHNLRGPANNIKMLSDVLKVKHELETDNEDALGMGDAFTNEEAIGMVSEAATSLSNSLESMLNIAQIRLNKNIPFDDCSFREMTDDVISLLKGDIVEKNVAITCNFEVEHIAYPRPYLDSILYNLISNAIKYRNPDVAPEISISTRLHNKVPTLVVQDNGLGIDMEKNGNKVFKLHQVFHDNADSKGIGLYLVKTQIEALGGSISLESEVNKGTTFTVVFAAN